MVSIYRIFISIDFIEFDNLNNNCECFFRVEIKCKFVLRYLGLLEFVIFYNFKGICKINMYIYLINFICM